jgi:hypothetical protein
MSQATSTPEQPARRTQSAAGQKSFVYRMVAVPDRVGVHTCTRSTPPPPQDPRVVLDPDICRVSALTPAAGITHGSLHTPLPQPSSTVPSQSSSMPSQDPSADRSATQDPRHSISPDPHRMPQLVPSQVADPPGGTGHGEQLVPQLSVDESDRHPSAHS